MHVADEVAHLVQRLSRWLDDQVDPVAEHVEVEVGDECRHLDQRVGHEVQAGHFTVDQHETFVHGHSPYLGRRRDFCPDLEDLGHDCPRHQLTLRFWHSARDMKWVGLLARLLTGGV